MPLQKGFSSAWLAKFSLDREFDIQIIKENADKETETVGGVH